MPELQSILALWETARSKGEDCVLSTVVKTQGSSYRLPGARLLLTSGGQRAGSVSGGCLEDDLLKRAWWLTENGPIVRRYDTTADGELGTPYGLGCNGVIHLLLERVSPSGCPILEHIRRVLDSRVPAEAHHVLAPAKQVGTTFAVPDGAEDVFTEQIRPPLQLLLCGAGEDAIPLQRLAGSLGWSVLVFDGRAHYARPERFPGAHSVLVRPPGTALTYPRDPWTVGVIMTHSYAQDLVFLTELMALGLPYVGVLGPRKRTRQLLEDAGLPLRELDRLHAPMGLDIGADGPEQVAVAVVAEIQASLNRREGGQLRDRSGSIHADASGPEQDSEASGGETRFRRSVTCA